MGFGGILLRRLAGAVTMLACAGMLGLAAPAFAQSSRISVEGLPSGLGDDLKPLLREEPKPDSLFEARRQAERGADIIRRFLESRGYYAARAEPFAEGLDDIRRGVRVSSGALFTIASAKVDYIGEAPDPGTRGRIEQLLAALAPGVPAEAQPVLDTEDAIIQRLKQLGYPDARADPVDALADGQADTIDFTFKIVPGLRASFGELAVDGLMRTHPAFVEALKPWKPNERYSQEKFDEFRQRLADTGLFDSAAVSLSPTAEPPPAEAVDQGAKERDVMVKVIEGKRHTIALGASASTSEGLGAEAEWERRNLTGFGDSVSVRAVAANLEQSVETVYRRPNITKYGRNLRVGLKVANTITDAYEQTGANFDATVEERLTGRVRASVGAGLGFAAIEDDATRTAGTGRREVWIVNGSAALDYVGVRDVLDPQDGLKARIAVEPGVTFGDTTIAFARLTAEGSIYYPLTKDLVAATRARVGSIIGPNGAPPDRLFFAGGGGSVRGYDYQSLSPRAADGDLLGGRSVIETSLELRYRATDRLGYVAFIDAGAAGDNVGPPIGEMKAGAGFGVRYYAGFGPLRADIAVPLNKQPGDSDFQVYISIGQAF